MAAKSIIEEKSFNFAVEIVQLSRDLREQRKEYDLSRQILKSGTSIAANAREAKRGQTKANFAAKLTISLKEAEETLFWLELLKATDYIDAPLADRLHSECEELVKMLVATTKHYYRKEQE